MESSIGMRPRLATALVGALALAALQAAALAPAPELLSRDAPGNPGNGNSYEGSATPNGRWVAYGTYASNLGVPSSTENAQIVLRDRVAGVTTLVSHGPSGEAGNGYSYDPFISANGRWIAYSSNADNLVAGDLNGAYDLFLHDRATDETRLVSVNGDGVQGDGDSQVYGNGMTANGRWLVFESLATNLVSGAADPFEQVYLADLRKGTITLASRSGAGDLGNGRSRNPSLSPNGRFVAFQSEATNLVTADVNGQEDVFLRDLRRGTTVRASVTHEGNPGNGGSREPVVSSNGRFVAFNSSASNLVASDGNGTADVFLRDLKAGTTIRVNEPAGGGDATGGSSSECCMSANGKAVAYYSSATNLNPGQASPEGGVYLYDAKKGTTRQLDLAPNGNAPDGNGYVWPWSMTPSGKHLVMASRATQLTSGDTGGNYQVYFLPLR